MDVQDCVFPGYLIKCRKLPRLKINIGWYNKVKVGLLNFVDITVYQKKRVKIDYVRVIGKNNKTFYLRVVERKKKQLGSYLENSKNRKKK